MSQAAFVPSTAGSVLRSAERRICELRPRPSRRPRQCYVRAETRNETLDERGFVVPQPGDVVLYAGRWAGEQNAGVVDTVRSAAQQSRVIVDVREMRRLSDDLFAVQSVRRAGKLRWFDVAQLRIARDAVYVPGQDAYRIPNVPDGYARVAPLDENARLQASAEYERLKTQLLTSTFGIGLGGSAIAGVLFGKSLATAYASGAIASLAYLAMLQSSVDALGAPTFYSRFLSFRFALPPLPFALIALSNGASSPSEMFGSVDRQQAIAVVLGLLTYKIPFLARTFDEFVDGLSRIEIGKTGMVGTVATLAARRIKSMRQTDSQDDDSVSSPSSLKPVFVFAGPSGVGKTSLIRRLMDDMPQRFQYSVSHTTRAPRANESNGEDYNFVTGEQFEQMIDSGQFVEYAYVHGQYYGTSYQSINAVQQVGTFCVLDLDVQGVDALCSQKGLSWQPIFVWIAPPSVLALEQRLRKRGTETEETLKTRLNTAMREMSYAATNDAFDLTIINDDFDDAYGQLREFVEAQISPFL
ncbi:Guanylate kinase [Gracilariopsis chorda]|uniref:guanylate kinase n=1 Tax=Gracilariopsis chorda TaxID=448386 RepID=A0A2V3J6Z2_9FLOR|nr:Guanylate kinase [Gracilariopsis chorda]|eukprot:PXF50073.1 Guanylate kinase [Gracilariopsis chorda]